MNKAKVIGSLIAVLLLAATMTACGSSEPEATQPEYTTVPVERGDVVRTLYVPGELVLTDRLTALSSPVDSELLDLLVRPGEQVKKGDIVAHLDEEPFEKAYEDAVAQAEADLEAAKSNLESAKQSRRSAEHNLRAALHSLKSAQYNLELAEHDYEQALQAEDNGTDLYRLQIRVQVNKEAVYLAQDGVDIAQEGVNVAWDKVNAAKDEVDAAEEALEQAEEDKDILEAADIRAPCDGTVLDIKFYEGDMVTRDSPMIVLGDLSQMELMVTIGQDNIASIKPDMSADITLDALLGTTIKGKVDYVVPQKSRTSQTVTYEVYLRLNEIAEGLLPGMTGGATILVAEKHDVLRILRRLVKIAPDGSGRVEVLEQGQPAFREVVIGVRGDTHYEIVSGLSEGELVIQRGRF